MTSLELTEQQINARPLPGRILLHVHEHPAMIGALHVPDSARTQTERDLALQATVLAVGYGEFYESSGTGKYKRYPGLTVDDVKAGDVVCFTALKKDLNRQWLLTSVTRVEAVMEPCD